MNKIESEIYLYICPECDNSVNIKVSEAPKVVRCVKCHIEMNNSGTLTIASEKDN